jgi:DNA-binding NtrC family response regulator
MEETAKDLNCRDAEGNALAAQGSETSSPRIVVVDDEDCLLEMVGVLIRDWRKDITLLAFRDGATAWQELVRADPDLLITDMVRPGMAGRDMLPLLAKKKVKYPILVHSGYVTETEVRQWAGPDLKVTFLKKPWRAEEFRRQLLNHLGPSDNPKWPSTPTH